MRPFTFLHILSLAIALYPKLCLAGDQPNSLSVVKLPELGNQTQANDVGGWREPLNQMCRKALADGTLLNQLLEPTESPEGLIQHKGNGGVLMPLKIKGAPEGLVRAVNDAHHSMSKALEPPATYHASKTHAYVDVLRQCLLAGISFNDPKVVTRLCESIIYLHVLDDIREAGFVPIDKFLESRIMAGADQGLSRGFRSGQSDKDLATLRILEDTFEKLMEGLPKSDQGDDRRLMYLFGLERMFWGADLFGKDEEKREENRRQILRSLDGGGDYKTVRDLINKLSGLYIAFTVNALFEVIEVYRTPIPPSYVVHLMNLLYGPLVNAHNIEEEIQYEDRGKNSVPTVELLRISLGEVKKTILQLSRRKDQQLVLERLPWMLESFSGVLSDSIRQIYLEFLFDPNIRRLIPKWSDAELSQLRDLLNSNES